MSARIAMVGTFDVGNFGDLLFPLLAKRALAERLADVELELYSYRGMREPEWYYPVRPLHELPERVGACDLLIVGGGHLVRFDSEVAPGYRPVDPRVPHPTGLWLGPTMLALGAGVPVAWNAVGVHGEISPWAAGLVGAVTAEVDLLAVRDEPSAAALRAVSPDADLRVVPDTGWGAARLVPDAPDATAKRLGIESPYVLVQASPFLGGSAAQVGALAGAARARGIEVVEVAVSPALDDRPNAADSGGPTTVIDPWPGPADLLALIAGAEAVVAWSLHMSVAAASCGVPVHRPASPPDHKYAVLDRLAGVHTWEPGGDPSPAFGRAPAGQDASELAAQTAVHWDAVATLATGPRPEPRAFVHETLAALGGAAQRERSLILERDDLTTERDNLHTWVEQEQERFRTLRLRRVVRAALAIARIGARLRGRERSG